MRDALTPIPPAPSLPVEEKISALHALGAFYVRQGYPRQGLALLLSAQQYGGNDRALDRITAYAYLLCGLPKKCAELLMSLEPHFQTEDERDGARVLMSRALLALGRVDVARDVYERGFEALSATRGGGRRT